MRMREDSEGRAVIDCQTILPDAGQCGGASGQPGGGRGQ